MSKTCCTGSSGVIGLLACSGACYHAVLSKRLSIAAMGAKPDKLHDICYIAPVLSLIYGDSIGIPAAKKQLRDFDRVVAIEGCRSDCATIVAVEGCGANCATKLLAMYGIEPEQVHISEDRGIENRPPPFTTEEIDTLYKSLDEAVDFIMEVVGKITEVADKIR